jgi:hypothetical protein
MEPIREIIQLLVAPVVMISACGLLCLALYNRLMAIVLRARTFHKELFDTMVRLAADAGGKAGSPLDQSLHQRIDLLEKQVAQILGRAKLVRNSLILLLNTVAAMLCCSVALGLSLFWSLGARVALGLFGVGVASMLGAVGLAIMELTCALDPVLMESTAIDELEQTLE